MKLYICIPTLNRCSLLSQTVDSILPQMDDAVEICISNNASVDETKPYLKQLSQQHPKIKIINQPIRLDIDASMESVCANSGARSGDYIYFLGDDDVLLPGAIKDIFQELITKPDLLVLNAYHANESLRVDREHLPIHLKGKSFTTLSEAFSNLWSKMPFGSFLAKSDCFKNFQPYLGTAHAYSGSVWSTLEGKKALIRCGSRPNLLIRGGAKTWESQKLTILFCDFPLWFSIIRKLPSLRKAAALCLKSHFDEVVRRDLFKKAYRSNEVNLIDVWRKSGWKVKMRMFRYYFFYR